MCAVVKHVSLLPAQLVCVSILGLVHFHCQNLTLNNTFTRAAQQRHVSFRYCEGATAYRGLCTISTAARISRQTNLAPSIVYMVYHLVSCSPIFQCFCPTNRLCSPPSDSYTLYLHIAPSQRSTVSTSRKIPLDRTRPVASCRIVCSLFFLVSFR